MRFLSILLVCLLLNSISNLQAQSFSEQIETIFEHVDLSQVSSGLLKEAGLQCQKLV